jgi:hypothetical protein
MIMRENKSLRIDPDPAAARPHRQFNARLSGFQIPDLMFIVGCSPPSPSLSFVPPSGEEGSLSSKPWHPNDRISAFTPERALFMAGAAIRM